MINLEKCMWLSPFVFFLGSYFIAHYCVVQHVFETPFLLGKSLQTAVQIISDHNLNARILLQKEDNDVAQGTILGQIPSSGRSIRSHQSVFLIVSKKPQHTMSPLLVQKNRCELEKISQREALIFKYYYLPSNYPHDQCIAQIPEYGQALKERKMIVYLSSGLAQSMILPYCKGYPLYEVQEFFERHAINVQVVYAKSNEQTSVDKNWIVLDQKPLGGSFITPHMNPTIQLYVG